VWKEEVQELQRQERWYREAVRRVKVIQVSLRLAKRQMVSNLDYEQGIRMICFILCTLSFSSSSDPVLLLSCRRFVHYPYSTMACFFLVRLLYSIV
jgi:hypothetical protein